MKVPKTWAPLVSQVHDAVFCSPRRVRSQASRSLRTFPTDNSISVAIPHYNRGRQAHQPLCNLLSSSFVREVVFFDDGSSAVELDSLREFVGSLGVTGKIRIEGRTKNMGAQATKLDAVEACQSEWVLVLDSDNTAFPSYLKALSRIKNRNPETIYCSPFAFPYFSFHALAGRGLDFDSCASLTKEGLLRGVFIINDGNYLVHRANYLERIGRLRSLRSDVADVMMANYLWLSKGGSLQVLNEGSYHHRIDGSSFWMRTAEESRQRVMQLFSRFSEGLKWDEDFAAHCLSS